MTNDFHNWLIEKCELKLRSARDVQSRLKRVNKFIDISQNIPEDELILNLNRIKDFKTLQPTVQSQLRRSIKLYRKFLRENNS
ncbi:hypothetical protein [Pseudogracilibacillus sp. SO10305]|uniref:hypothetical protein n=1 Tax=Pseudogracilibacillus sp. SO10305 TaxID=3098292 RepID=UPI00300E604C